jgi:hypothetical protein
MALEILSLNLGTYQIYGLLFLLGSLSVASISDLKNMSAQKEFFHFWTAFTVIMFIVDAYPKLLSNPFNNLFWGKWIVIILFSLLSYSNYGIIFKLSRMDIMAVTAVASILNFYSVIIFIPLLKIISALEKPLLKNRNKYPFLPVVLSTVCVILVVNFYLLP